MRPAPTASGNAFDQSNPCCIEAAQAAPLVGSFTGAADEFLALNVAVEVTAE